MNSKINEIQQNRSTTWYEVVVAEENKNGKTYWHNVGVGFPLTSGSPGLSLKLSMFPNLRLIVKESLRGPNSAQNADDTQL